MENSLQNKLITIARQKYQHHDPAHDIDHVLRVLKNVFVISKSEGGDLDILIPAAVFHDIINYPKNDLRRKYSAKESAETAAEILSQISDYPQEKVKMVSNIIETCSLIKGQDAASFKKQNTSSREGMILQDADGLEATGAIEIMRTFSYSGYINRRFYDSSDPFAEHRPLNDLKFAVDHFFTRSLNMIKLMNTRTAKEIAKSRIIFTRQFLYELKREIN